MTEGKMTPGPWHADEHRVNDWRVRRSDGNDGFWEIAEMSILNPEANARAIACLPELVEVARKALETIAVLKTFCTVPLTTVRAAETEGQLERILARIDGEEA